MTILWAGGEDVDFSSITTLIGTNYFRSDYARCGLMSSSTSMALSTVPFQGGAISSGWCSGRVGPSAQKSPRRFFGLANATQNRGLLIGTTTTDGKTALWKMDGVTATLLASESGLSIPSSRVTKFDLHLISLGASGLADVYCEGDLVISFSGDLSWLNDPDAVGVLGGNAAGIYSYISEGIVADEDTRTFSLFTAPVIGAGDSNAWSGSSADVDEISINDADVLYTDAISNDVLLALGDLPSGTFSVKAVREVARVAKSASGTATQISLGIKSGGTVDVDSAHSLDTAFASIDRLMTINPVTGVKFTQSDIDALQFAMRSA